MSNFLDEEDLKALFNRKEQEADVSPVVVDISPKRFEHKIPVETVSPDQSEPKTKAPERALKKGKLDFSFFAKYAIIFVSTFIISYFLINFQAITTKFRYNWDVGLAKKPYTRAIETPSSFNPIAEAHLVIPKIGVNAPITWEVPTDQTKDALLNGVVQVAGTALPGQEGNVFITGHSSYYSWVQSDYKDVFSLLDKLSVGDKIYIQYQNKMFTYEVNGNQVVSPDQISVMNFKSGFNLSLMTCVPIGTNINRLIVSATQMPS